MDDRHLSRHNFKQQTGQHGSDCSPKILIIIVDAVLLRILLVIKYSIASQKRHPGVFDLPFWWCGLLIDAHMSCFLSCSGFFYYYYFVYI